MKEKKERKVHKKKPIKKLKISDIKRSEGAHVGHLLAKVKAKEVELTFLCVLICLIVVLVSLYLVFSAVRKPNDYDVVQVGNLSVTYNDVGTTLGNIVDLTPVEPMSDSLGKESKAYTVTIHNTSNKSQEFQVVLVRDLAMIEEDKCSDKQVPYRYFHYQIGKGQVKKFHLEDVSPILLQSVLEPNEKKTYQVRIWINNQLPLEYLDYHYHGKLTIKNIKTVN